MATCALLSFVGPPVSAQEVVIAGQVRPRFEVRDPMPPSGGAESYTIGRTRLSARIERDRGIWGFVQLQDVRIWGEESSTAGDFRADGLDLHQGFIQFGSEEAARSIRVGRFEQNYGGQRLIGALDWAQQARAFDGVRGRIRTESGLTLDGFAFQLSESTSIIREFESSFSGAYAAWEVVEGGTLDLFALWLDEVRNQDLNEVLTSGLRYVGSQGPWSYRVEGTLQRGERADRDVRAWMMGVRAGRSFADGRVGLAAWYDHLSGGDGTEEDDRAFDTLFGTNHKFYGYADLFLDLPVQTAGRGFRDAAVKTRWVVADGWTLTGDLHRFWVADDGGLDSGHLGDELDLVLTHPLTTGVTLSGGVSQVWAGGALGPVRGIGEDVQFAYLMIDLSF